MAQAPGTLSQRAMHVARTAHELLDALVTRAPKRDREVEAAKARARSRARFGRERA